MTGKRDYDETPGLNLYTEPGSLHSHYLEFLQWLSMTNYTPSTVRDRRERLKTFLDWAAERGIMKPQEVTKFVIERFQRHLFNRRKTDGKPLLVGTQSNYLIALKMFFKWLSRQNIILYNPAADIVLPRLPRTLPRQLFTHDEVERIINQADVRKPLGIRDRAIMETMYSTGMRRGEVAALQIFDISVDMRTILIRQGKGNRDRMVPIGGRALGWIMKYLEDVRPYFAVDPANHHLYVTRMGEACTPDFIGRLVTGYVRGADLGKKGSCHLFRHAMATGMLENGADIRFIQQMLGHARLDTTQIYTNVSIRKLSEVHENTHPARDERN